MMYEDNNLQIVYVLTNPAMPDIVKIGKTTRKEVGERMKELYGTGVPLPFDCAFACRVTDAGRVEQALHTAFGNVRINSNREFFKIEPERVIAILRLLDVQDEDIATQEVENEIDNSGTNVDKQANEVFKKMRRPIMDFFELGIEIGAPLLFTDNPEISVEVVNNRKVKLDNEEISLTEATRRAMQLPERYPIQPSPYWTYNGMILKSIYEQHHEEI